LIVKGATMARPLRISYAGAFYHITSRGNERKEIFKSNGDREKFLFYLESATRRYDALIHVYCLMSNHYHLLMETPAGNLSQIMQHINGAYTTYFNVKRQRSGHLFQGRYKAILVDMDEYAKELSRYIHLNPVRAGIVDKPEAYNWSSYQYFIGLEKVPEWFVMDFILGYFGNKVSEAQNNYHKFHKEV
jgi:putative transposase